eukprot:scaffold217334_cov29-Tisochrysis_lutea.AAC.1
MSLDPNIQLLSARALHQRLQHHKALHQILKGPASIRIIHPSSLDPHSNQIIHARALHQSGMQSHAVTSRAVSCINQLCDAMSALQRSTVTPCINQPCNALHQSAVRCVDQPCNAICCQPCDAESDKERAGIQDRLAASEHQVATLTAAAQVRCISSSVGTGWNVFLPSGHQVEYVLSSGGTMAEGMVEGMA